MSPATRKPLQRLRYWPGQALLSRDFRDQDRLDARRRELHNRALHDVPGAAVWRPDEGEFGLEVTPRADGKPGFTVNCGVGYDCAGRLLVLQQPRDIDPPDASAILVLLARRPPSGPACCCPPSDAACAGPQAGALENDSELGWRTPDILDSTRGVLLARVTVDGAGNATLDGAFRPRTARPMARPRLARGETVRGNTPWERWEIDVPDGQGGLKKQPVGVQTHIDTSAAGFTATPRYFATLTSPGWDLDKTEFAPAFFPQVADPSVDGFIFRLLMVETARRRYNLLAGTSRVTTTRRLSGDRLQIDVESAAAFRINDAVALLRPRADVAFRITEANGLTLRLESPLPDTVKAQDLLAVGHAPRVAKIGTVTPGDPTVLATVTSAVTIKKNDVLVRLADNAVTTVNSAGAKGLTIQQPFAGWTKDQPIGVAPRGAAVAVKTASTDAAKTTIVLATKTPNITAPSTIVGLDDAKKPTSAVASVTLVTDDTLEIKPPLTEGALADIKHVSLVRKDVAVRSIQPQNPGVTVQVDDVGPFAEGDFVAALSDVSAITVIEGIDPDRSELSLQDAISLPTGGAIAAADWITATTVDSPAMAGAPAQIVVGRSGAVPPSSFLARDEAGGFSAPFFVKAVAGNVVTLARAFDGLSRLDTLAVGVFPRIVTVIANDKDVRIAEAGAVQAGDVLIPMDAAAGPVGLAEVVSAAGDTLQLSRPLSNVSIGVTQLGVVNFTDATKVADIPGGAPFKVKVDRKLEGRAGDFVAVLTHYADNSNAGTIAEIQGASITLAGLGVASGDGIVRGDWIDGGILGRAAVSPFQPLVRFESIEGLSQFQRAAAFGYDLLTHSFSSHQVWLYVLDPALNSVYVGPSTFFDAFRYRPETLAIVTTFNTDFPSAFATFAQKQNLAVCWIGCQQEFPPPSGCPGVVPDADCCASTGG